MPQKTWKFGEKSNWWYYVTSTLRDKARSNFPNMQKLELLSNKILSVF